MDAAFIKNISKHIYAVPPLPQAVQKLFQLTENQHSKIPEISQVVSSDPSIASKLLQIVNSPFYGFRQKINTISQAIMLVGLDAIKSMALSFSIIQSSTTEHSQALDRNQFWQHSLATAIFSKHLAAHLKLGDPEEAYVAGLLHDIGKLILIEYGIHVYPQVLQEAAKGEHLLCDLEHEAIELDHTLVGAELCRHWKIPPMIIKGIELHHAPLSDTPLDSENYLGSLVSFANQLAKVANFGSSGNHLVTLTIFEEYAKRGLNSEILQEIALKTRTSVNESSRFFGITHHTPEQKQHTVEIQVKNPSEATLLALVVLGQGHQIGTEHVTACVTDSASHPSKKTDLIFLDFSQWKKDHAALLEKNLISISGLHQWVAQSLPIES